MYAYIMMPFLFCEQRGSLKWKCRRLELITSNPSLQMYLHSTQNMSTSTCSPAIAEHGCTLAVWAPFSLVEANIWIVLLSNITFAVHRQQISLWVGSVTYCDTVEVQQHMEHDFLGFSKGHSDPYWTGQTALNLEIRMKKEEAIWKFDLRVNCLCQGQKGHWTVSNAWLVLLMSKWINISGSVGNKSDQYTLLQLLLL